MVRIGRVVDLSLPVDAGTQIYPGDPVVTLTEHSTIGRDGFNLMAVTMGSQSGTNVDAPFHFLQTGARIDEVDLGLCVGTGVVVDVRGLAPRSLIGIDRFEGYDIGPGAIVVLHTGWPEHYGTDAYLDHPYLSAEACAWLLDRGVRTICLDAMNLDETPSETFACHHLIAAAGGLIVENLRGLELVDWPDPLISVLPLRLTGADGAPTRAVALELL